MIIVSFWFCLTYFDDPFTHGCTRHCVINIVDVGHGRGDPKTGRIWFITIRAAGRFHVATAARASTASVCEGVGVRLRCVFMTQQHNRASSKPKILHTRTHAFVV